MKEYMALIFIILENLTPIYNIEMVFDDRIYSIVSKILIRLVHFRIEVYLLACKFRRL